MLMMVMCWFMPVDKSELITTMVYITQCKIKIHSSCEIKYFVETHLSLQAVCDTPIARITGYVSSLRI